MMAGRRASSHRLGPILAALILATAGTGCANLSPTPPPTNLSTGASSSPAASPSPSSIPVVSPSANRLHGLLLLAGRPGAMSLELIGEHGQRRSVPLPDPTVGWLSSSLDGRLLATTLDGRAFVSEPIVTEARPAWRPLNPAGIDATALAGRLAFGSLSPDGTRAAFVAADLETTVPSDLVIAPIDGSAASVVRIARPAEGAQPSWIDRRLVLLTRTPADRVGSTILDLDDGRQSDGPGPLGAPPPVGTTGWIEPIVGLSIAADGSTLAVASAEDGRIEVYPAGAWLAGADTTAEPVRLAPERDGSLSFVWLAMSSSGDRLAVVRANAEGDSVGVTLHDRANGWAQGLRVTLPARADRAVVAWLP